MTQYIQMALRRKQPVGVTIRGVVRNTLVYAREGTSLPKGSDLRSI